MLILTRTSGTSIRIADNITITVLRVYGGHVRLGVNAPRDLVVKRQEALEHLQKPEPALPCE